LGKVVVILQISNSRILEEISFNLGTVLHLLPIALEQLKKNISTICLRGAMNISEMFCYIVQKQMGKRCIGE